MSSDSLIVLVIVLYGLSGSFMGAVSLIDWWRGRERRRNSQALLDDLKRRMESRR